MVQSSVPGIELLAEDNKEPVGSESDSDGLMTSDEDDAGDLPSGNISGGESLEEEEEGDGDLEIQSSEEDVTDDGDDDDDMPGEDSCSEEEISQLEDAEDSKIDEQVDGENKFKHEDDLGEAVHPIKKIKIDGGVDTENPQRSLRYLKKIASSQGNDHNQFPIISGQDGDGFLSDKDFGRIRKLQARKAAQATLAEHGFGKSGKKKKEDNVSIPSSEHIHERWVNPASLEANIRRRREKEERVASVRAGQEERPGYGSRTSVKQKKTGGLKRKVKKHVSSC